MNRLGAALNTLGVAQRDVVAVMDWDSHRYLECFFAIPMTGAVLQTVNIRLSPEQILYTLNHAGAEFILCNTEFLRAAAIHAPQLTHAKTFDLPRATTAISDTRPPPSRRANTRRCWPQPTRAMISRVRRTHQGDDDSTRPERPEIPKGVYYSHRQIVLHTLSGLATLQSIPDDVYMPITPMFHVHAWGNPYNATVRGIKQVYPGRY